MASELPQNGLQEERTPVHTYLENAITQQIIVQRMKTTCDDIISICGDIDNEHGEATLILYADTIMDESIDLNFGISFFRCGGIQCIKSAMRHPSTAVRAAFVEVVGVLAQNNEPVQNILLSESALMDEFVELLLDPELPTPYQRKLLGALSSMIRGNPEAKRVFFILEDGVSTLKAVFDRSFADNDDRTGGRAAITLCNIYIDTVGGHENIPPEETEKHTKAIKPVVDAVFTRMNEKADLFEEYIQYFNDHRN